MCTSTCREKHVAGPAAPPSLWMAEGGPKRAGSPVQLVTKGIYCGNGPEDYGERKPRGSRQPNRLVDALSSTPTRTAPMGVGRRRVLYFWIRRQDLAACRFDAVWCILQTTWTPPRITVVATGPISSPRSSRP